MQPDTASSRQFAAAMTALVTAAAIPAFCCSERPTRSFTITWGILLSFRSDFPLQPRSIGGVGRHRDRLAAGRVQLRRQRIDAILAPRRSAIDHRLQERG